jgi:hypothetical protein
MTDEPRKPGHQAILDAQDRLREDMGQSEDPAIRAAHAEMESIRQDAGLHAREKTWRIASVVNRLLADLLGRHRNR